MMMLNSGRQDAEDGLDKSEGGAMFLFETRRLGSSERLTRKLAAFSELNLQFKQEIDLEAIYRIIPDPIS